MRPSSGLTASLLLLGGLVACTEDRKPVDETQTIEPAGFGCLDDIGEVADDPLSPTPAPFCRIGVLGSLKLDGRPVPTVAVIDRGAECNRTPKGYAIDLAPGVAARFHAAFQVDPDFVPILFDARRRGLQDMLAGTVVVEAPQLSRGSAPSPPRTPRR